MDDRLVVSFGCDGSIVARHKDDFNLSFLGDRIVARQCDIVFNDDSQCWDIHYIHPYPNARKETAECLQNFSSYDRAVAFEVRWLNDSAEQGVLPMSSIGLSIAEIVRKETYT